MQPSQIVGSVQVRNEDIYIERAVLNIMDFCDSVIITDHQSTDQTLEICQNLASLHPKICIKSIQTPQEAALAIAPYFGTDTWIFGVDGDEIYDPHGLKTMRKFLLDGIFSQDWCIFGNVLNVASLNMDDKTAKGYLAPPSRSMTKLYNFSLIERWINCPERLLGGEITFRDGYNAKLRKYLHTETPWEQSYFRCLHMPFMKRSTRQRNRLFTTRLNPDEINRVNIEHNRLTRFWRMFQLRLLMIFGADWKSQKYRRGPLVAKDVSAFFDGLDRVDHLRGT